MLPDSNKPYHTLENHDDISSFFPFSPSSLHLQDGLQEFFSYASSAAAAPVQASLPENKHFSTTQTCTVRRRLTRKDRHSKICTAQGPRDRRMRLSLDVAREFFDLQDLLGFDKASKTVQWLLTMSKSSIKELVAASKSESPSSQCEEEISTVSVVDTNEKINTNAKNRPSKPSRSPALPAMVARESRERARARARKRTLEKKLRQIDRSEGDHYNQQTNCKSSSELVAVMDPEHCSTSSNSIVLFNYNQQNMVSNLFQELWDHMNYTSNHIDERYFLG